MKKMLGDVGNAKKKLDNVKRVLGTPTKGWKMTRKGHFKPKKNILIIQTKYC
jgi:hypothetical protein